jgi:hypothetical protein
MCSNAVCDNEYLDKSLILGLIIFAHTKEDIYIVHFYISSRMEENKEYL